MANINEILARAAALRQETALNSIDPERAGGIMYDTLLALNELWLQQGAALVISKIYASVAAMNADTSPVSDLTGKPIRPGMVVVIASSDSDNGSVYRYNGTSSPRWSLVGKIGNITPEDSLTSDSTQLPLAAHQGKVLDGKISQLGQYVENSKWVRVVTDNEGKVLYGVKTDGKFYFGDGCPPQVVEHVTTLLNEKVDKVAGKSLIDSDFSNSQSVINDSRWLKVITDSKGKIIDGITKDGKKVLPNTDIIGDLNVKGKIYSNGIGHYSVIGSPVAYVSSLDTTGLAVFNTLEQLYGAFDSLVSSHPDWFSREADIGLDASETYYMRHYCLRYQHPLITTDRKGEGMNLWSDEIYRYRRILINMGIHPAEKYATLGGYLMLKEILESNEEWARFIRNNFVLDIIPCANPWGLANGSQQNVNGKNLNRTFFEDKQQENINIENLVSSLKTKGLIAIIDLHNTGTTAAAGGDGYFVAKPSYKYWNYYAVLTQQIAATMYEAMESVFGTTKDNHFHLWDGSENSGQLHQYADSQGLLGCTFEISSEAAEAGSLLTKSICANLINAFGIFEQ